MSDLFSKVESLRRQASDREAERVKIKQQQAAENRARMPQVSAWVDKTREEFPGAKVTYAKEGEYKFGEKFDGRHKVERNSGRYLE